MEKLKVRWRSLVLMEIPTRTGKKHNFKAVLVPTTLWTLDVETRPFFGGFPSRNRYPETVIPAGFCCSSWPQAQWWRLDWKEARSHWFLMIFRMPWDSCCVTNQQIKNYQLSTTTHSTEPGWITGWGLQWAPQKLRESACFMGEQQQEYVPRVFLKQACWRKLMRVLFWRQGLPNMNPCSVRNRIAIRKYHTFHSMQKDSTQLPITAHRVRSESRSPP